MLFIRAACNSYKRSYARTFPRLQPCTSSASVGFSDSLAVNGAGNPISHTTIPFRALDGRNTENVGSDQKVPQQPTGWAKDHFFLPVKSSEKSGFAYVPVSLIGTTLAS